MAGVNRIVRQVNLNQVFADATALVDSTVSINQGDLVILDTSGHLLALPTVETDGATFLGIMPVTVVEGKLAGPYTGLATSDAEAPGAIAGPQSGVECALAAKSGDAFAPGVPVYLYPTGGRYHVSVSGTKAIGHYVGPNIASAAAGQKVICRIGSRYPGDTLVNG